MLGPADTVVIVGAFVDVETIVMFTTEHLLLVGECAFVSVDHSNNVINAILLKSKVSSVCVKTQCKP